MISTGRLKENMVNYVLIPKSQEIQFLLNFHISQRMPKNELFSWAQMLGSLGVSLALQSRLFLEGAKTCNCLSWRKMYHYDSWLLNWGHWQLMRWWYHPWSAGHRRKKGAPEGNEIQTQQSHTAIAFSLIEPSKEKKKKEKKNLEYVSFYTPGQSRDQLAKFSWNPLFPQ